MQEADGVKEEILRSFGNISFGSGRVVGVRADGEAESHGSEQPILFQCGEKLLLDCYIFGAICRFGMKHVYVIYRTKRRGVSVRRIADPIFSFRSVKRANGILVEFPEEIHKNMPDDGAVKIRCWPFPALNDADVIGEMRG